MANVFSDDICQNPRCFIFTIKPSHVLPENGLKQRNPQFQSKVFTTEPKQDLLTECRNADSQDEYQEHQAPEVSLFDKCITMFRSIDWQGNKKDVSGQDEAEQW